MNLGLFDAQWVMRRNFKAMESSGGAIDYKNLVRTFLSSIAKLSAEFNVTNPVLLFDGYPYKKMQYIELKTSRYYPKESDMKVVPEGATEEEKAAILAHNNNLAKQLANEAEFRHAKNFILKFTKEIGIPALKIVGYEADDLAYYIANMLGISHHISFITLDSDWKWNTGENTTFYRCNRAREVYDRTNLLREVYGVPLHVYGNVLAICSNNHNDIVTMDLKLPVEGICKAIAMDQIEYYLGDKYEEFKTKMYALDCRNFFTDELKNTLISELEIDSRGYDYLDVQEWSTNHGMPVNYSLVGNMVARRERTCGLLDNVKINFPTEVARG